jgi:hypothetical protein
MSLINLGMNQPWAFLNSQNIFCIEFVYAKERINNTVINSLTHKIKKRIEILKVFGLISSGNSFVSMQNRRFFLSLIPWKICDLP